MYMYVCMLIMSYTQDQTHIHVSKGAATIYSQYMYIYIIC